MGAILNTRLPRVLNEPTWMITESASITNNPPTRSNTSSFLVSTASIPIAPPIDSEPTSPMNTLAGYVWYQRKPTPAPNSAAQNTESSTARGMCATCRYSAIVSLPPPSVRIIVSTPAMYANTMNVPALMMAGPIARPSRPSVRFTAFAVPTTTSAPNTQY